MSNFDTMVFYYNNVINKNERVQEMTKGSSKVRCPECGHEFDVEESFIATAKAEAEKSFKKQIAELEKNNIFGKELFVKSVLFDIMMHVISTKQYVEITNKSEISATRSVSAIDSALYYIREHYRDNITMEDILQISSYSKSHFIRLFKSTTGMNVTDYINKYRIEKSCLDLIYTDKNITEIATENGFNTVQYFSKTFKNYMNCTPKQYQKNGRSIIVPSTVSNIL